LITECKIIAGVDVLSIQIGDTNDLAICIDTNDFFSGSAGLIAGGEV